ncbi:MAG: TonB-dependent receptor SusC [Candidatus Ordinivivax streblomastigis]|uniref:TonB-dependent receptor SusC n=1 Tax=Candidatus Ordinivivax streblomastigis TaxID=2540710 RepID=A0A5M8P2H8_9BACT|nr:MAG: TonB-dependent receptor SusC [Candidatus Ordinivivax streblomastigis]
MKNKLILFTVFLTVTFNGFSQTNDTILVKENYFGTPLLKVLNDFEVKYGLKLKYDSTLIVHYTFDYTFDRLYLGTPPRIAFDGIFQEIKDLSYYTDENGVYCIVLKKNLPKNRTQLENKRFVGNASRHNLTVYGRIKDQTNGEPLPFASVYVEGQNIAASTNTDGYFTLYNVPSDKETLIFKYLGYETQYFYLSLEVNVGNLFVELLPATNILDEIVIVKEREDVLKIPALSIGVIQTTAAKIADLPALGEKDLFRTFQLMPGISGSNESSAGLYVRGGTPDQNLVLYDGFTIYHQEHLMGVFSAFNTNAIKDVQLHKGGFDAKYGGRLSSVMEIVGKTGNDKQFNLGGDVGFLGFNAFMEIPFKNENGSFFVAGRRSFPSFMYDKFTDVYSNSSSSGMGGGGPGGGFNQRNQEKPKSYFYDLNAKLTYNLTKRDIVSLSFFNGEDDLDNSREGFGSSLMSGSITDKTDWGNIGSSLKWSRNWDNKFYSNLLASYSNYYSLRDRQNSSTQSSSSSMNAVAVMFDQNTGENNKLWDYSLKFDNEYKFSRTNQMEFGLNYSRYNVDYRYSRSDSVDILNMHNGGNLISAYVQDKWTIGEKFTIHPGVRLSYYDVTSRPYFEPRFQTFYKINDRVTLKGSVGYYYQFVNRIVREDISAGSRDIWLLSGDQGIPVSNATHFIAGGSYETNGYLFDVEAYYKKLNHLSEYTLRFAPSFIDNTEYQQFFYNGEGYSRGIDFLLQKKYGKLTGWVGYTLGESRYKFPVYGDGYFSANQDVTHEFKIVGTYKPIRDLTFTASWISATGKPYTEPIGAYTLNVPNGGNMSFIVADAKNNARYPDYHRLDLLLKYDLSFIKSVKSSLSLSLFNVYDHTNVWYREYSYDTAVGVTQTNINLLGFTPNVTLSIQLK